MIQTEYTIPPNLNDCQQICHVINEQSHCLGPSDEPASWVLPGAAVHSPVQASGSAWGPGAAQQGGPGRAGIERWEKKRGESPLYSSCRPCEKPLLSGGLLPPGVSGSCRGRHHLHGSRLSAFSLLGCDTVRWQGLVSTGAACDQMHRCSRDSGRC